MLTRNQLITRWKAWINHNRTHSLSEMEEMESHLWHEIEDLIRDEDLTQEFLLKLDGIQNPTARNYSVNVSTTKEPDFIMHPLRIIPPRPTSTVLLEGGKIVRKKVDWYCIMNSYMLA